jgi:RNA polymerase sigma-70 factor (ECF subfamily)
MQREEIEALYAQHGPALLAYAATLLRYRAAAQDALHQVFLNLMKSRVPVPQNPKAYLFRAVRNAARNLHRVTRREVELRDRDAWFDAPIGALQDSLALQAALLQIPEEQREAIVMHVWGDLSFEEIAAVVGVPANTAASRYRYGLSKLRGLMQLEGVHQDAAKR